MASLVPRKNKAGEITSYQVKWRLGGTGDWQTERFDDSDPAKIFKQAVEKHGHQWPPGWVKGEGYVAPEAADESQYQFERFARESIKNRTAGAYYKRQRLRAAEMYIFPTFAHCDIRSPEHFSKATIGAWINRMRQTKVRRGNSKTLKDMAPETLRGLHGLLSSVLKEAMVAEPPLRDRNPCDLTRLPKDDDHGVEDDDSGDDQMEFMTPEEVAGLVSCFPRASDRLLVRSAFGTGLRWGEITALATRHVRSPQPDKHEIRVTRAWKREEPTVFYLGPPKTRAGRRTVEITAGLMQELRAGIRDGDPDDLVFPGQNGQRMVYGTFWERWNRAVSKARNSGLLPKWKVPTFHDLRHSHVAALLSDGHSLTYVQRRLGHESIKTTSDRYGHLLDTAHQAALVTLDRVMGVAAQVGLEGEPVALPRRSPERAVYAVHLGGQRSEGFWRQEDAEAVAAQWELDRAEEALVEVWTAAWWKRSRGELDLVRDRVPDRRRMWEIGPACYSADGTERVERPEDHGPRAVWAWEWEPTFTDERAVPHVEWGESGETEARAYGVSREAVVAAYEQARADALRVCARHPQARQATEGTPEASKM
ncbi:tyrosine-type recombinase/integrase [Streptomyces sp. WL006]|uniref:tyrosine-type recombinase/integrase n=1 Tax=Streptomyces sp. WL006 TaxID=3423915 RepID=UPI003F6C7099